MMEVRARAPGKIILSGEHAVVHGYTAVSAAINHHTSVSVLLSNDDDDMLMFVLADMGLELSWPLERIREALKDFHCPVPSTPKSCSSEFLRSLLSLIEEPSIPEANFSLVSGVSTFLWLYTTILGYKSGTVTLTSELPLGSGLVTIWGKELELVNKWAFEGEKIIHGKPSGIDNTVSTYGNLIKFRSGEITRLESNLPLRMLITNTKVGRNTKALLAGLSERTHRHPEAMTSVFKAIDSISKELSTIIQIRATNEISVTEKEEKLEELMEMNQGLLQCMGVSHATIETVLQTTLKYKLSSKLTGAGGGSCVLTLLPKLLSSVVESNGGVASLWLPLLHYGDRWERCGSVLRQFHVNLSGQV